MGRVVKRLIDIAVAGVGLLLLGPAILLGAVLVRAFMGRPAFFPQARPGLHGEPFTLFKLRTMTDERGLDAELLSDAERLTPFGKLLRKTSIDELPQFWNILVGEMSLVGPRPLLVEYLDRYTPEQARRHDVLPGITGWFQVMGQDGDSWERRLELDVWYVDNWSLWLDMQILAHTVWRVGSGRGFPRRGGRVERFSPDGGVAEGTDESDG